MVKQLQSRRGRRDGSGRARGCGAGFRGLFVFASAWMAFEMRDFRDDAEVVE